MKLTIITLMLKKIEQDIIEETDNYNDAIATGNRELANMIYPNLRSLLLQRDRLIDQSK